MGVGMTYLMAGQLSELDRLQLQSRVWEPAGERLLAQLGAGTGQRVLDVGCGCLGWLRLLSNWVGPSGRCVGSDLDQQMLHAAATVVDTDRLANVDLVRDDLFDSQLPAGSFDLVHARFQLAPLGRFHEQLDAYAHLLRPGGTLVLEDPDTSSWRYEPPAPAAERLIRLIIEAFRLSGGDFGAGRSEYQLLADRGWQPRLRAEVVGLPPLHPYLRLPLQFATSLRPRMLGLIDEATLDECVGDAGTELSDPRRWGLTFTLVQTWAVVE
jgi:ubiquinone/menaquinone biosynthesis C-methylase UbiE